MVTIKTGNVFDSTAEFICHQVNCQGKMNSGVAKEVRQRYPKVYRNYVRDCESAADSHTLLGNAIGYFVDNGDRCIVNCFGQDTYGYDGQQYTNVEALKKALSSVAVTAKVTKCKVAMPYKIGCVRGGADWDNEVYPMIQEVFKDVDCELWKLD